MSKAKSLLIGFVVLMAVPVLAFGQKASKIPTISSLSPNTKTAGAGNIIMTVTGSNFTSGTTLQWNGTGLTTTYVSSAQLQASVPGTLIATAGTASVKAYTSGRYGGTSNTLSFTITAPAPTTTTTTTTITSTAPLAITTSSVPSATAGAAFNCNFAGTGGTPAYTWSLPSGGGALPPGLILATTGTLTGTPTTAGTYSFTVQAMDSAGQPQSAQKVFSMSVAAPPTPSPTATSTSGIVFQTGFEDGDPIPSMSGANMSVVSGVSRSGSNSMQTTFNICGDSTNPACGLAHQDQGGYSKFLFNSTNGYPNGFDHVFVRAYFKFHFNPGETTQAGIGRKLFYFLDQNNTWHGVASTTIGSPNFIMSFNSGTQSIEDTIADRVELCYPNRVGNCVTKKYSYVPDAWYYIEAEVQVNTPGAADGKLNLWLQRVGVDAAPINVVSATSVNIRGNATTGIGWIQIGDQCDRQNWQVVDEVRHWDDIAISTTGPVGP